MEPMRDHVVRDMLEPRELDNGAIYIGEWARFTN